MGSGERKRDSLEVRGRNNLGVYNEGNESKWFADEENSIFFLEK